MNESMALIFGVDCSGIIYNWNLVMDKLTGYSAEEAIGKSLVSFMSEEERGSIDMLLSSVHRSNEQQVEQECVLLTKREQKPLCLFVKCTTKRGSNGLFTRTAFIYRSRRYQAEIRARRKESCPKSCRCRKGANGMVKP